MNAADVQRRLERLKGLVTPLLKSADDHPWVGLDYEDDKWDDTLHTSVPLDTPVWSAFGVSGLLGRIGGGETADGRTPEEAIALLEMKLIRALKSDNSGRQCVREALEAAAREREAKP